MTRMNREESKIPRRLIIYAQFFLGNENEVCDFTFSDNSGTEIFRGLLSSSVDSNTTAAKNKQVLLSPNSGWRVIVFWTNSKY